MVSDWSKMSSSSNFFKSSCYLHRSWHKYEEDKNYLPRVFNFETINDNDPLSRNLNEVHTCVIPRQCEHRILKTPEELAANRFETDFFGHIVELKDPRKLTYSQLKSSKELIKKHNYSSQLQNNEQLKILATLEKNSIHNPKLVENSVGLISPLEELPEDIKEKLQKEIDHFLRCAEIYYHRHITQFNSLLSDSLKQLLLEKWKRQEAQLPHTSHQAITRILRNTNSNTQCTLKLISNENPKFRPEHYRINEDFFVDLKTIPTDSIKLFLQCRNTEIKINQPADIHISLDTLTKIFVDGTEFNTIFSSENDCSRFTLTDAVPLKKVNQPEALEEAIKVMLQFNIEWDNANKFADQANVSSTRIDFKVHTIAETMSKMFKSYKKKAGANNEISLWRLESASQNLSIGICQTDCCFLDANTKAIFSIKFEYQTSFGAEQMSREELLKEWIQLKFTVNCKVLRFRIDAASLVILSVTKLTVDEIQKELKELYNYDPHDGFGTLFNIFNCVKNLPNGIYILQAQRNDDCNSLLIYREDLEHGKTIISDDDFEVIETFTRKWIPIDKKVVTFLHLNEQIAPCCFPHSSLQRVSYIMPKKIVKKVPQILPTAAKVVKKAVTKKSPEKSAMKRLRKRRNKNTKRKTVTKNLD